MDRTIATALRYDTDLPAPFVTARGKGELAEKMLELAVENGVPVRKSSELAQRLIFLKPGSTIPPELFEPIARIFAYLMQIDERYDNGESKK